MNTSQKISYLLITVNKEERASAAYGPQCAFTDRYDKRLSLQTAGFDGCSVSCLNKNIVDRTYRLFEIIVVDADDDIELTGSLVDHPYIDLRVSQG